MATPLSRWHRVFATALERRPAVSVQVAVTEHLSGRTASRSEAVAARRAAHSFVAAGHARLERARTTGPGSRERLVLVRTDTSLTSELLAAALVSEGPPLPLSDPRTMHTEAARRLVEAVREAAAQARHVEASHLSPTDAAALSAALELGAADLSKFRRRLRRAGTSRRTNAVLDDAPD